MPTYEYECLQCGHRFDMLQQMSDEPVKECPKCGGKVHRLLGTGSGIIFRGSGFYATDYQHTHVSPSSLHSNSSRTSCGRETPCCGRSQPCEKKPCE